MPNANMSGITQGKAMQSQIGEAMTPPDMNETEKLMPVSWQEEINIVAAQFNCSDEGNEAECFAKALTLSQNMLKEIKLLQDLILAERKFFNEQLRIAREGLESISKNTCCDKCQEAKLVALTTLSKMGNVK